MNGIGMTGSAHEKEKKKRRSGCLHCPTPESNHKEIKGLNVKNKPLKLSPKTQEFGFFVLFCFNSEKEDISYKQTKKRFTSC